MRLTFAVVTSLVAVATPAQAQGNRPMGRWDREVAAELRRAGQTLAPQGFHMRSEAMTGSLNQGETDALYVGLREGVPYAIVGVCDSACTNLDLRLLDAASHELAVSLDAGPPVLRITPAANSKYRLRVIMTACSHSPCRFSVGVFER